MSSDRSDDNDSNSKKRKKKILNENESDAITSSEKKNKSKKGKSYIVYLEEALTVQEPQNEYSQDLFLDDGCLEALFNPLPSDSPKDTKRHKEKSLQDITENRNDSEIVFYDSKKSNKKKDKNVESDTTEHVVSVQNNHQNHEESYFLESVKERTTVKKKKKKKHKKNEIDESTDDNSTIKKKKKHKTVSNLDTESNETTLDENYITKRKKHKHKLLQEDTFPSIDYSYFDTSDVQPLKKKRKKETDNECEGGSNNSDSQKESDDSNKRKQKRKNNHKTKLEDSIISTDYSMSEMSTTVNSFKDNEIANDSELKMKDKHRSEEILDDLFAKMKESASVAESESVSSTSDHTIEVHEDPNNYLDICLESDDNKKSEKTESRKSKIHKEILKADDIQDLPDLLDNEELTEIPPDLLNRLCVTLPWPVSILHTLETTITGKPSAKIRQEMEALGVTIKTGTFSHKEDKKIIKNWRNFCKLHDLPNNPTPFANNISKSQIRVKERLKFARFLAHGLDDRPLNTVYKRFQRIFRMRTLKCGKFTPEEDEVIRTYMNSLKSSRPWADLAKLLDRDPIEISRRFKYFQDQELITRHGYKWDNKDDIKKFVNHVLKVTKLSNIEDLKDRKLLHKEFKKISKKLDYPLDKLRAAWTNTIYPRIFVKNELNTGLIKSSLINKLIERGETDLRTINWEEIAKDYKGFTPHKLCKIFRSLLNYYVPKEKHHNLSMCLIYLEKFGTFKERKLVPLEIDDLSE